MPRSRNGTNRKYPVSIRGGVFDDAPCHLRPREGEQRIEGVTGTGWEEGSIKKRNRFTVPRIRVFDHRPRIGGASFHQLLDSYLGLDVRC